MTSNEHSAHFGPAPATEYWKPAPESTLKFGEMQVERKAFRFALKENPQDRFLRVTENDRGRVTNLTIPSSGLEKFKKVVDEMIALSNKLPE